MRPAPSAAQPRMIIDGVRRPRGSAVVAPSQVRLDARTAAAPQPATMWSSPALVAARPVGVAEPDARAGGEQPANFWWGERPEGSPAVRLPPIGPTRSVRFADAPPAPATASATSAAGAPARPLFDILKPEATTTHRPAPPVPPAGRSTGSTRPSSANSLQQRLSGAMQESRASDDDLAAAHFDRMTEAGEPIFWEIALVWSLSKNQTQKEYRIKHGAVKAFQEQAAAARGADADGWMQWGWLRKAYSVGQEVLEELRDPVLDDMLESPTWRDVRAVLLKARLSVRLLRSKDADEFFMAIGAPLSRLQEAAQVEHFELRLRRETGYSDKPHTFFPYQKDHDDKFERFEEAGTGGGGGKGADGKGNGDAAGAAAAQLERGGRAAALTAPSLSSMERQRLIDGIMQRALLSGCKLSLTQLRNMHNACIDYIYLHDEYERRLTEDAIGSTTQSCRAPRLNDLAAHTLLSLERPRRYLGEQVCFYFAFLRFYTRALVVPGILGAATYVVYWLRPDIYLLLIPAFCMLLVVWSAVFTESWKAREATLRHVWDMDAYAEEEAERLGFRGTLEQGVYTADGHWVPILPDDLKVMDFELQMPQTIRASNGARNAKQLISMVVLLLMGVACIVTTLGIFAFRAYISTLSIGPYLAGTLNAVAITVLNSLFRALALGLNEWENHRRASSFTQALVYKMFIFQFINCYFSLFYIAFVKPYRTRGIFGEEQECIGALRVDEQQSREQRCYDELQTQLMMIFLTNLLVGTLSERFSSKTAAFSEAAADWYESYKYRQNLKASKRNGFGDSDAKKRADAMRKRPRTAKRRAATKTAAADEPVAEDQSTRSERLPSPQAQIKKEQERSQSWRAPPDTAATARPLPTTAANEAARRDWWRAGGREGTETAIDIRRSRARDDDAPAMPIHPPGGIEEYDALLKVLDEQDDLPMLLSEEHGLGPTFYEYNEIAIQFGYICMFAVSFPPAALLALGNNVLEFDGDAYKLLRESRRVKYEGAVGIKPWDSIFRFLEVVGVVTNTLIYLLLSAEIRALSGPIVAFIVVIVVTGLLALKAAIVYLIPDVPKSVLCDMHKERWVAAQLRQKLEEESNKKMRRLEKEVDSVRASRSAASDKADRTA